MVLLLAGEADLNATDKRGRTMLNVATQRNSRELLAELFGRRGALD